MGTHFWSGAQNFWYHFKGSVYAESIIIVIFLALISMRNHQISVFLAEAKTNANIKYNDKHNSNAVKANDSRIILAFNLNYFTKYFKRKLMQNYGRRRKGESRIQGFFTFSKYVEYFEWLSEKNGEEKYSLRPWSFQCFGKGLCAKCEMLCIAFTRLCVFINFVIEFPEQDVTTNYQPLYLENLLCVSFCFARIHHKIEFSWILL